MKRTALGIAVLVFLLAASARARAGPILDQSFDGGNQGGFIAEPFEAAQTFTVGLAGKLAQIDVLVYNPFPIPQDLLFDVRPTVGGIPINSDTAVLASATIPVASVPTAAPAFLAVDISSFAVAVTPGEQLAIVLRTALPFPSTEWVGQFNPSPPAPYARGDLFFRAPYIGITDWTPVSSVTPPSYATLGFETFVSTGSTAVPEPGSLTLLGIGGVGLLAYVWRRRKT